MPTDATASPVTAARLVAVVCAAQVMVQIGAYFWPALLPEMMRRWSLSNSEAGWITAIFYAAYMVSVPVLVTLTDRIDAKRVYLAGQPGNNREAWEAAGISTFLQQGCDTLAILSAAYDEI